MNVYQQISTYLRALFPFAQWPEAANLIERFIAQKPQAWKLPGLACQAVGGQLEEAIPVAAAIACHQIGIILIDDMLDEDPRGEHHRVGVGVAANQAAALMTAGLAAVLESTISPENKLAAQEALVQMLFTTALGQDLDVRGVQDEAAYWRLVKTKSSPFYGAALQIGAIFGGANASTARRVREFGDLYGEMIQIHDDINDSMATPANPDWTNGRAPLPVLFAHVVDHPARDRFLELRQVIPDPAALKEAQTILVRCGAISYALQQLLVRYRTAQEMLDSLRVVEREPLERLLEEVVIPIKKLLTTLGAGNFEQLILHSEI